MTSFFNENFLEEIFTFLIGTYAGVKVSFRKFKDFTLYGRKAF